MPRFLRASALASIASRRTSLTIQLFGTGVEDMRKGALMITKVVFRCPIPALVVVAAATPAEAATYLFTLTGPATASFSLDSSPTPTFTDASQGLFALANVDGTLNGSPATFTLQFFLTAPNGGGFDAIDPPTTVSLNGPQLFTGALTSPTFTLGTFDLSPTAFNTPPAGPYSLSIREASGSVPEPASWAMMLGGFGLVGGVMRSRQKAVVTFA